MADYHLITRILLGLNSHIVLILCRHEYEYQLLSCFSILFINGFVAIDFVFRIPGFWISINAQKGLVGLCVVGMLNTILKGYVGIDVVPLILEKYYGTK